MVGERATKTAVSCGEAVIDLLAQHGVSTVFGIPGVHTLELYRGLAGGEAVRHVLARHEQGAGFMADGFGRTLGEPGVCLVISGPGTTNVITPIAQAYHDSKPLLVISGAVAKARHGRGTIHDLPDQRALMAEVTAFSALIEDPADLPEALERAFASFRSGRPRPVHIAIPVDVLSQPAGELAAVTSRAINPPTPAAGEIDAAAALLAGAKRPLILLGGGAADAGRAALRLAEHVAAPIGLSINARGAIPASHPLCLGSALTFSPIVDLVCDADVVVAAGTEFSELDWWAIEGPPRLRGALIRIDIDSAQLDVPIPAAIGLNGDAATTLDRIAGQLGDRADSEQRSQVEQRVAKAVAEITWPPSITDYLPVLAAIDAALPPDRIIAADSTQPAYAANHALGVASTRSWMMPVGYGTLGCALPMAIGAKVAAPERPVCCLVGDGGILFTLQELATARDLRLGLPIVVWNNTGYGEIADAMTEAGIPPVATNASAHDLVAIARGFGCGGECARDLDHLSELIAAAGGRDRPTLIEVRP